MPETPIRPQDLILLADELEMMFRAGMPLASGLNGAASRWSGRLGQAARRLAEQLEQGTPVEKVLQSAEELPPLFRAVVAAGIRTGRAQEILKAFSESARQLLQLKETLARGMVYPAIVVTMSFVLFVGLLFGLLPVVAETFAVFRLGRPEWLPVATALRNSAVWWSWMVPLGALILFFVGRRWLARQTWSTGRFIPFGGRAVHWYQLSSASQLLALLIEAELPLPRALKLTGDTIGSARIRRALRDLSRSEEDGVPIAKSLVRNPDVPPLWRSLFASSAGNSRALVEGLQQVASSYAYRASGRAELVGRLLPALMVCIIGGGVTLLYAGSLFVPLSQLWLRLSGGAI